MANNEQVPIPTQQSDLNRLQSFAVVSDELHGECIAYGCHSCGQKIRAPIQYAGKRAKCTQCQATFTIPGPPPAARGTGESDLCPPITIPPPPESIRVAPSPDVPHSGTSTKSIHDDPVMQSYDDLQWYRRNDVMSILTIAALVGMCFGIGWIPILPVCISLATGDVYYKTRAPDGSLKRWHGANKVAAFVILGVNVLGLFGGLQWLTG